MDSGRWVKPRPLEKMKPFGRCKPGCSTNTRSGFTLWWRLKGCSTNTLFYEHPLRFHPLVAAESRVLRTRSGREARVYTAKPGPDPPMIFRTAAVFQIIEAREACKHSKKSPRLKARPSDFEKPRHPDASARRR